MSTKYKSLPDSFPDFQTQAQDLLLETKSFRRWLCRKDTVTAFQILEDEYHRLQICVELSKQIDIETLNEIYRIGEKVCSTIVWPLWFKNWLEKLETLPSRTPPLVLRKETLEKLDKAVLLLGPIVEDPNWPEKEFEALLNPEKFPHIVQIATFPEETLMIVVKGIKHLDLEFPPFVLRIREAKAEINSEGVPFWKMRVEIQDGEGWLRNLSRGFSTIPIEKPIQYVYNQLVKAIGDFTSPVCQNFLLQELGCLSDQVCDRCRAREMEKAASTKTCPACITATNATDCLFSFIPCCWCPENTNSRAVGGPCILTSGN